jgi:hypothetical protein
MRLSLLFIIIFRPGTTPPVGSITVPETVAPTIWAETFAGSEKSRRAAKVIAKRTHVYINSDRGSIFKTPLSI